jgi:hypothetical protein
MKTAGGKQGAARARSFVIKLTPRMGMMIMQATMENVPNFVIILLWMVVVFVIGAGMLLVVLLPFIVLGFFKGMTQHRPVNSKARPQLVQSTLAIWRRRDQKRHGFPILQTSTQKKRVIASSPQHPK